MGIVDGYKPAQKTIFENSHTSFIDHEKIKKLEQQIDHLQQQLAQYTSLESCDLMELTPKKAFDSLSVRFVDGYVANISYY